MKAPFLFMFICYANGFEETINSYVFPTEDEVMVNHFTSNPRTSVGINKFRNDQIELRKSGKLLNQKMLSWLVTTTLAPKQQNYTVFTNSAKVQDISVPISESAIFLSGYNVDPSMSDIMFPDPLMQRRSETRRRRHKRSSRKQKLRQKSSDEIDHEARKSKTNRYAHRSHGDKSDEHGDRSNRKSQKKNIAKQAFYHGSDLERMDGDDESTNNDRYDKRSSETYKNDRMSQKGSVTQIQSSESDERSKTAKRNRDEAKHRSKIRKGSFKINPSFEFETKEEKDKSFKKESYEKDKKYIENKKSVYQSNKVKSELTPIELNERERLVSMDQAPPVTYNNISSEKRKDASHKSRRKRYHKKNRATIKSNSKNNYRKSYNENNKMKKLRDDSSYENFRRHYYSNPRRQKREVLGFEYGEPYRIGETRRLIAASTARIEDFPYMASIQKYGEHWCSGAILNPRVVITTANCVWRSIDLSRMKVRVGSRLATSGGQIADIQEVAKHPGWSIRQKVPDFDLALLLVSRPFKFCDTVHSVDLPNKNMYPAFDDAFIASYGSERRDGVVDDSLPALQSYRAEMIERNKCNDLVKRFNVNVTNNFICFAQKGRRAPCTRDTGAPAVSDGVVWGVASWSIRKKCGTERYPAVFSYTGSIDNMAFLINATLRLMTEKRLPTYYDNLAAIDPQGKRHPMG